MSIAEKVTEIKKIVSLVCDVVPVLVTIIKETILLFKSV